jgi:hypothetical protein
MSIFRPRPPQAVSDITSQSFGGSSSPFANTSSSESFSHRDYDDPDYAHLGLDDQPEEEEDFNVFGDMAKGAVFGAAEAGRSVVGLLDVLTFDLIPDEFHEDPYFKSLKPQGTAGAITSGLAQFVTGFIPGLGVASLLGKAGKAATGLNFGEKTSKVIKGFTAGAIADFAVFDGHTKRLSNILAENAGVSNIVTDYLKADLDDAELEGRMKNAIEGAVVGGAISSIIASVKHLKALKNYDGSETAKKKVTQTRQELDSEDIANGSATESGIKNLDDVRTRVENLDPEDTLPGGGPDVNAPDVTAPDVAPTPKDGVPDVSKLQAPISGPQAIYQNKNIVQRLSSVDSIDELEDMMEDIIPELMATERRTVQEMAAQMVQLDELRNIDSSPLAQALRSGQISTDKDVELIAELALRQQVAYAGSTLSFYTKVGFSKELEALEKAAGRNIDESTQKQIHELTLLAEQEMKRFEFFTLKQATIGTGVSDIFRARQAGNVVDIQDLIGSQRLEHRAKSMYGEAEAAKLADVDDVGLDALNEMRIKRTDEEISDTLGDIETDVTPTKDDLDSIRDKGDKVTEQRQKELARLEKQLEIKRQRSQRISEMDPDEIKGTQTDPGAPVKEAPELKKINNDIRVVQGQIKHHDQVLKDERAIIKLREEEHYADTLSASAYAKRRDTKKASLARLKKIKDELDPGKANSAVKQLQDIVRKKGKEKISKADASTKLKALNERLDNLRQSLLDGDLGPKGKLTPTKLKQDPELKELYEKIQSVQRMLKEERAIPKVLEEVKALARMSDNQFEVAQIIQDSSLKRTGKNAASALQAIRQKKAEYIEARSNAIKQQGKSLRTEKAYAGWLASRPGDVEKGFKDYMSRLLYAADSETPLAAFQNADELAKMSKFRKFANLGARLFQRNLISGASTLTVNVSIPQTMRALKRFEMTVGAGIRTALGDVEAKAVLEDSFKYHSQFEDIKMAFSAGAKSGRDRSDVVTGGASPYTESINGAPMDALDPRIWGVDETTTGGKAFKWINTFFNWPFAANAAGDGMNKALVATSRLRTELNVHVKNSKDWATKPPEAQEAWKASMHKKAINQDGQLYSESRILAQLGMKARDNVLKGDTTLRDNPFAISEEYERLVSESKDQFINDKSVLDMIGRTKEYAQEVTATSPMKSEVINMINRKRAQYPPLTLLLPFINTPANILHFGLQRTPFGAMSELAPRMFGRAAERREAFAKMSPIQQAEFTGRMATSAAGGTALLYFAYLNKDKLTGSGPRNPDERKALEATGWKPNSFNLGDLDNPTYVSYQRLDPWATMIGIAADVSSFAAMNPDLEPASMEAVGSLLFTISEGITDKSFLRGLNNVINMIQQPEVYFGKGVRDVVSGLSVPQSLSQMTDLGEAEVMIRESRTVVDAILRKVPIAHEKVPPKRTFLGEAVYKQNPLGLLGVFNPVYVSSKKNDSVDKTIMELVHGFGMPPSTFINHRDTDMRQFYNEDGRQAYDRFLELSSEIKLGGKTMRDSLKGLINSRQFKAMTQAINASGGRSEITTKDPRISLMNKVIGSYRLKAKNQVVQEFPELLETLNNLTKQKNELNKRTFEEFNKPPIPTL